MRHRLFAHDMAAGHRGLDSGLPSRVFRLLSTFRSVTPAKLSYLILMLGLCAHAQESKAPYNMLFLDFGGDVFSPQTSTASNAVTICAGGVATQPGVGCSEALKSVNAFTFGMGVRPIRYLQIDTTLDILGNFNDFGNSQATYQCVSGCAGTASFKIGGTSGLLTTGARLVLPLRREKLLLSVGAGWAYLRAFEHPQATSDNQQFLHCPSCRSVSGNGPSEVAEVMYMVNPHIGIGAHYRNVQINSSGLDANGLFSNAFYATTFKDRFSVVGAEISFRFQNRR